MSDEDLPEFKPGYIINEPLNMIEVHFEDVAHKSVPLIDGVYHWIDKLVTFDDGRVVGLNFWIYKPPLPTERYRHVKRGSVYRKVGEAQVQARAPLTDYEVVTIYVREDTPTEYWVRRSSEFNDGRFVGE